MAVDETVIAIPLCSAHEYTASGKIGETEQCGDEPRAVEQFADTVMHFGEPSAHDVMEAVHTEPVQNDELPVASFIAVLMPLRQVVVSDAHTEPELITA